MGSSPHTILETANGGCAFLDFDSDDHLDALVVGQPGCHLYRNDGRGRFRDVTRTSGLSREGRWMGCAVADYDNDGDPDLLLTGYRCLAFFRNDGGRFTEITRKAGFQTDLWTTSAAFADVNGDGLLDLYIGAYLAYRRGTDDLCRVGPIRSACGPEHYSAERGLLYLQHPGGFRDATSAWGLRNAAGKTWGVTFADYDADGWMDLYLANDMEPANLYRNVKGKRFAEVGLASGTAYDASGNVQGGMGVDWGDTDGDGRQDLLVTTYVQQAKALYRNLGGGQFEESSEQAGIGLPTRPYVGFGCGLVDFDHDGWLDLFIANGHVRDNIQGFDRAQQFRQPMQLLANNRDGTFRDVSSESGSPFRELLVGRGTAFGDYDRDGDIDILVVDLDGPVRLLQNQVAVGASVALRLIGTRSNRDAVGATATARTGGRTVVLHRSAGKGVLSASDAALHLGLGTSPALEDLRVRWPDGSISRHGAVQGGADLTLRQP